MPVPKQASELDDLIFTAVYADATTNYYGHASPGTAKSASGWRIKRETLDSQGRTIDIQYARGNAGFVHVWNDYASFPYS